MNCVVLANWLKKFNTSIKAEKHQVLLLLDKAAGHNFSDEVSKELANVRVEYFPANTASIMQPLSAGIIKSFMVQFKRILVDDLSN